LENPVFFPFFLFFFSLFPLDSAFAGYIGMQIHTCQRGGFFFFFFFSFFLFPSLKPSHALESNVKMASTLKLQLPPPSPGWGDGPRNLEKFQAFPPLVFFFSPPFLLSILLSEYLFSSYTKGGGVFFFFSFLSFPPSFLHVSFSSLNSF